MSHQRKLQIAIITLVVLLAVGVFSLCGALAYGASANSSVNATESVDENHISRSGGGLPGNLMNPA